MLLKNTDTKVVAATVARAMRPMMSRAAHSAQRGFVAHRDLTQDILELDPYVAQHGRAGRVADHAMSP